MSLPDYQPMLATRRDEPFSAKGWWFEPKWDGVRTLLRFDGESVRLRSRAGNDVTHKYPEITAPPLVRPAVLDGEVVAFDDAGRPSFERIQSRMTQLYPGAVAEARSRVPVTFVAFDLLFDGEELIDRSLAERRERLAALDLNPPFVVTHGLDDDGEVLWQAAGEHGFEGIVAKRHGSPYQPGVRSPDWLKIARVLRMRTVVAGYTGGGGGRTDSFGSLLVGLWADDGLRWVGAVGTGFSHEDLRRIKEALDQQRVDECPFVARPQVSGPITYVEPKLVALVGYKELTSAGRLRAPRFLGFVATDPAEVTWAAETS